MDSKPNQLSLVGSATCRLYEAEADLDQMYGLLVRGRSQTNDWRFWRVGQLAFSFFMIDCHIDPEWRVCLWRE